MKGIFYFFACTVVFSCAGDKYPKLSEIFKSLSKDSADVQDVKTLPNAIIKDININIETLNMSKLRQQIEEYSKLLNSSKSPHGELSGNVSRRSIPYIGDTADVYFFASRTYLKVKILDNMLQLLYMARHKIRQVETHPFFKPHDPSYRIAYLYAKIFRLFSYMANILHTMKYNIKWAKVDAAYALELHQKAVQLHVDFVYLWRVLIRLDEEDAMEKGRVITRPPPGAYKDYPTKKSN